MDQVKSHMVQSIKAHNFLIKLTPLLVSVSLFPFLFSPSSFMCFLHQFSFYFSSFPLQLFTHTIDKNCMFLLCNGLLVFVGITRSLSGSSGSDESSKYFEGGLQTPYSDVETNQPMLLEKTNDQDQQQNTEGEHAVEIRYCGEEVEENIEEMILEEGEGREQYSVLKEEEEPGEEIELLGAGDEEEDKESEIDEFLIGEILEEEEAVEETNLALSTEELNKKFDDFIRRMKEDLRIEAQRHLVMV
ncbi:uncharacterized protein LOC130721848 [Lotus japonicus]|uniref:uncharacterized protein LOC130721848 n=1 Tax=Lotus japonicus TaxID=34305 RepID=UPI0025904979|nr:uncharacterized protein LOC130721848 [Lotus japonicus]